MGAQPCPLCKSSSSQYYLHREREFLQCNACLSVFLNPKDYLSAEAEKKHYLQHNNDPEDIRYQKFVSPVTNSILEDFTPAHKGLDFGSGTGSPIIKILTDNNFCVRQYDLFFHNNTELLSRQYDYIACSETAEHFRHPYEEFRLLHSLLNPGGKLYVMTDRFEESRDFGSWFYKTDPTHVFLYHTKAFEWIKQILGFRKLEITGRLAVFSL